MGSCNVFVYCVGNPPTSPRWNVEACVYIIEERDQYDNVMVFVVFMWETH